MACDGVRAERQSGLANGLEDAQLREGVAARLVDAEPYARGIGATLDGHSDKIPPLTWCDWGFGDWGFGTTKTATAAATLAAAAVATTTAAAAATWRVW